MQLYSPFEKPLRDLQTTDLHALKDVAEGWYVEYKREAPKAEAIAKSLSALANTYGGWFFLGIEEASKEHPVAGTFPGIVREEVDACLQRLRKCAADHLNPTPHFETKVLWGPDNVIGLARDRAIICVWVPQSAAAPHVHKSGQIYRRVADASEPRPETDRFVLDQLWRRGDEIRQFHQQWSERDPEFSKAEEGVPYVRLMLTPDPWRQHDIYLDDEDQVRAALAETSGVLSAVPFDTVYTSAEGFVGRQLKSNDLGHLGLTWRMRRNLMSDVLIPLQVYEAENPQDLAIKLRGYQGASRFVAALRDHKLGAAMPRIVDLNMLFNLLIGVAEIQERLCKAAGWSQGYFLRIKLLGAWRTIPFLDVPEVIERFRRHGPPMCLDAVTAFPRSAGPDNYFSLSRHLEAETAGGRVMMQAVDMFEPLALTYGIPPWLPHDSEAQQTPYFSALMDAGQRALVAQGLRNDTAG